jgi:hypothetical protein
LPRSSARREITRKSGSQVMVGDQFENYMMQRIIEFGTDSQQNAIYNVVYKNYNRFIGSPYAGFVISKLQGMSFEF